jgi:hypothetical protein
MDSRPLIEQIVTCLIDYDLDESNTIGELLHAIRVGEKDTDIPDREWIDHPRFGRVTPLLQEDTDEKPQPNYDNAATAFQKHLDNQPFDMLAAVMDTVDAALQEDTK